MRVPWTCALWRLTTDSAQRRAVALVGGLFLTACSDAVAPERWPGDTPLSTRRDSPAATIERTVDALGCAVGIDTDGDRHLVTFSRTSGRIALPALAGAAKNVSGKRLLELQVAERVTVISGKTARVEAVCLMPKRERPRELQDLVAGLSKEALGSLVARQGALTQRDQGTVSSQQLTALLMQPLWSRMAMEQHEEVFGSPAAARAPLGPSAYVAATAGPASTASALTPAQALGAAMRATPRAVPGSGPRFYYGDAYALPTVTVTGTQSSWIFDFSGFWWIWDAFRRSPGLSVFYYYDPQNCADANDHYFQAQARIAELQAEMDALRAGMDALSNLGCERRSDGKSLCVDLYIQSKRTGPGGMLDGNDRDVDPNARHAQSKAQVYLDIDGNSGIVYVSGTTLYPFGLDPVYHPPSPHQVKKAQIYRYGADSAMVELEIWNAVCTDANYPACPAITLSMPFKRGTDGQFYPVAINRPTDYPTVDVFRQQGDGSFQQILHDPEGSWHELEWRTNLIEALKREMMMPPGCYLQ